MSKPSEILRQMTGEFLRNEAKFGREERGEPDPHDLDAQIEEATQQALDCLTQIADEPGPEKEKLIRAQMEILQNTTRDIYTKVGIQVGVQLAKQKLLHESRMATKNAKPQEAEIPPPNKESIVEYWNKIGTESSNGIYERIGERANLQWLGGYLLRDGESKKFIKKSYGERWQEARDTVEKTIMGLADKCAAETVDEAVSAYGSVVEEISFTLGMQVGARINTQLLGALDRDYC